MPTQLRSEQLADQARELAGIVARLTFLTETNHVNLSLSDDVRDSPEIDVHTCSPGQLTDVLVLWQDAVPQYDADDILRRATVEQNGVAITFYRR